MWRVVRLKPRVITMENSGWFVSYDELHHVFFWKKGLRDRYGPPVTADEVGVTDELRKRCDEKDEDV